jgi:L-lactate dehydrogenase complex protein LldG
VEPSSIGVRVDQDLLAAFAATVEASAADHRNVQDWPDVVREVCDAPLQGDRRVAISPSLAASRPHLIAAFRTAGAIVVVPDEEDPAAAVADVAFGIVRGELGVAETGSVLVDEHTLGDRVVTMLCHRLIQVVHAEDVVARLDDVAAWLSARRGRAGFVALVTGPSRTADIERSLTIGVQGPQEVAVRVLASRRELDALDVTSPPAATGGPG